MTRIRLSVLPVVAVLVACVGDTPAPLKVAVSEVQSPAGEGSGEPFLSSSGDAVYLSWLEASGDGAHELRFSRLAGGAWEPARTIARSASFFVNWADFPSITPDGGGTLWAHWLQRGEAGGYDYGVRVARSSDGGETWSDPVTPHDDVSPTEHGFVSVLPLAEGVGLLWLDGREYAAGPDGAPPSREMTLRFRAVGQDGAMDKEMLVDGRVCDCCQTAAGLTSTGPVVAYRDRSAGEIRDIYVARLHDGAWTEGAPVHEDGWEIAGCPVNGPALAAAGTQVVVAWFTAAGDVPRVKVAFSQDAGATFGEPTVVDGGSPAGRVDVMLLADGSALVSWLERTGGEGAEVRLRRVEPDGRTTESATVTASSSARASGFPRMVERADGAVVLAWTDVSGEAPRVRITRVELEAS